MCIRIVQGSKICYVPRRRRNMCLAMIRKIYHSNH
jgi:hypothetical protein